MYLLTNKTKGIFRYLSTITIGEITSASKGFKYICQDQISINRHVKILIINLFHSKYVTYLVVYIYKKKVYKSIKCKCIKKIRLDVLFTGNMHN